MKFDKIVKEIRGRVGFSQNQLADALGVSFATVNRWENGRCEPAPIAVNALRFFCEKHSIDFAEFEGNSTVTSNDVVTLYHGSKNGLEGEIMPVSRAFCDFGKGFYMGTDKNQPLTLICNFPKAVLYTVEMDLSGLKILDIEVGIDWALLIAFHRGKLEQVKGTAIYEKYRSMSAGYDVMIGYIANDRMFVVLDRFFSGEITDAALVHSLSALQLGKQYVAITKKACKQVKIIKKQKISEAERERLKIASEKNRADGIANAEKVCKKYRREGRFFDEIIGGM